MTSSRCRSVVLTALVAAIAIVPLGACDSDGPAPDPVATRVRSAPLAPARDGAVVGPEPDVIATWTLPPGVASGITPQPDRGPTTESVSAPGRPPASAPLGAIPEPSPRPVRPVGSSGPPATDPEIEALASLVQPARLASDARRLVAFGTRHADSDTSSSTRGVGAAREWLHRSFSQLDGQGGRQVLVEFDDFEVGRGSDRIVHRNVVATLPGIGQEKRVIYVVAHYDSRVADLNDATSVAPGADDNASGAAALVELCRILSTRQWEATIRFVAFAAKETGLHGSDHHASAASRVGIPVLGVFNNDIIGSARGPGGTSDPSTVRVFSADTDDGSSRGLARYLHQIGERYDAPDVHVVEEPDRPGREGDHLSFSGAGFAAVRIVAGLEDPTRQHNARDTADRLDAAYHAAVVRLNVVAVANLALAPNAPGAPTLSVSPTEPGALLIRWEAADGPPAVGYFVAARSANQPQYDRVEWVGPQTEHVLTGIVPEEVAVAVAASDDLGHTSLFSPEARP